MKLARCAALSVLLFAACGDKKSDGSGGSGGSGGAGGGGGAQGRSLGAYLIEPPITANTPLGLKGAGFILDPDGGADPDAGADGGMADPDGGVGGLEPLTIIKDRFFTMGPTSIHAITLAIDDRVKELDMMAQAAPHVCLDEPLKDFAITTPLDLGFPQKLNCIRTGTSDWLAFGHPAGIWYLREGQKNGNGVLVRETEGNDVEAWIVVGEKDEVETMSQALLHLKSTKATGLLEFTVTGRGIGVGCGAQYQSNDKLIYVTGKLGDPPMCDETPVSKVCVGSEMLDEHDVADCQAAKLDSFALTPLSDATISYKNIYEIGSQSLAGLTDFSVIAEPDGGTSPDGDGDDGAAPDGGAGQ